MLFRSGEPLGDEPPSAALRRAQGEAPVPRPLQYYLLQAGHVRAVHQLPQQGADLPLHRGDEGVVYYMLEDFNLADTQPQAA